MTPPRWRCLVWSCLGLMMALAVMARVTLHQTTLVEKEPVCLTTTTTTATDNVDRLDEPQPQPQPQQLLDVGENQPDQEANIRYDIDEAEEEAERVVHEVETKEETEEDDEDNEEETKEESEDEAHDNGNNEETNDNANDPLHTASTLPVVDSHTSQVEHQHEETNGHTNNDNDDSEKEDDDEEPWVPLLNESDYMSDILQPYFLVPPSLDVGATVRPYWRDHHVLVDDDEIWLVGLPPELVTEFRTYFGQNGLLDVVRDLLYPDHSSARIPELDDHPQDDDDKETDGHKPPNDMNPDDNPDNANDGEFAIVTMSDGQVWSRKRADHWPTDMVWFDPADEACYESLRSVLRRGNFDKVTDALSQALNQSLVVHGAGAIFNSYFDGDGESPVPQLHVDVPDSRGAFYNVLVPIYLPHEPQAQFAVHHETTEQKTNSDDNDGDKNNSDRNDTELQVNGTDAHASLYIGDWEAKDEFGEPFHAPIYLHHNMATVIGSDSNHGTGECDYRAFGGFRLSMSIWVSEITEEHLPWIATDGAPNATLSPWPLFNDTRWYQAQANRSLTNDPGRTPIVVQDQREDCAQLKDECETDLWEVRAKCEKTCGLYMENEEYASYLDALKRAEVQDAAAVDE